MQLRQSSTVLSPGYLRLANSSCFNNTVLSTRTAKALNSFSLSLFDSDNCPGCLPLLCHNSPLSRGTFQILITKKQDYSSYWQRVTSEWRALFLTRDCSALSFDSIPVPSVLLIISPLMLSVLTSPLFPSLLGLLDSFTKMTMSEKNRTKDWKGVQWRRALLVEIKASMTMECK